MNPFAKSTAADEVVNTSFFGIKPASKKTAEVIQLPTASTAAPVIQPPTKAVNAAPVSNMAILLGQQNPPEVAPARDPRLEYNVFGGIIDKPYPLASPFKSDDPIVAKLSSKFTYTPPDIQPFANANGGRGYNLFKGPMGSFNLGNGLALVPKQHSRYLTDSRDTEVNHTGIYFQSKEPPLKADGTFNPDGWKVVSTKSQAMGGIMGTLSVIGAAVGSALFGPANGAVTDLTGSMDGLMTGSLQTVGGGAVSGAANIIKTVAGQTLGMSNAGNGGLATTLASASPAIAATAAGSGSDKLPTVADIEAKTNAATQPVNATPQATQAATPDNNGLLLVLLTGLVLLFLGVKKHG
jgi:hypothetical protein